MINESLAKITVNRNSISRIAVVFVSVALTAGAWFWWGRSHSPHKGGIVVRIPKQKVSKDPLQSAASAYNKGKYEDAEKAAERIIEKAAGSKDVKLKKDAARARYMMAYAAARQNNMKEARERFAVLRKEASELPDKGRLPVQPGQTPLPTLEEQGAYQHAVCTDAMGDKKVAEREFIKFIRDYPESPLIHGAVQRIGRMHGGDPTPEAEAAWKQAVETQRKRREAREREMSMCGPECLAELLKRRGVKANVRKLADEMKTSGEGTTLQSFADTAARYGLKSKGYRLTYKGLSEQKLPVVALVSPGHFVIIESLTKDKVIIWTPDAKGSGKADMVTVSKKEWDGMWDGVTLVLS